MPGKLTRLVGAVYRPARSRCSSRSDATSVAHRSSGTAQADSLQYSGPQIVPAIPMAIRPTTPRIGRILLSSHGVGADVTGGARSCVAQPEHEPADQ